MGKPREHWHPFDRKSGTGRGKEVTKGGHGKNNWGNLRDEVDILPDIDTIDRQVEIEQKPEVQKIKQLDEVEEAIIIIKE